MTADAHASSHTFSRLDRSRMGVWWWTTDHILLGLTAALILLGVLLQFGTSPAAAQRLGIAWPFHFAVRQCVFGAGAAAGGTLGLAAITPALTSVNAARIPGARPAPQIFSASTDAIVTTDFFAFDDSTNHYGLQSLGRACDMGDAMVAQALQPAAGLAWYAIRNASDPQMPNPTGNMTKANEDAASIYAKYGALTTAASLIATWAVIKAATT